MASISLPPYSRMGRRFGLAARAIRTIHSTGIARACSDISRVTNAVRRGDRMESTLQGFGHVGCSGPGQASPAHVWRRNVHLAQGGVCSSFHERIVPMKRSAPSRVRTCDFQINSLTLYRLSYRSKGSREDRTPISRFRVSCTHHYTMEPKVPPLGNDPKTSRLRSVCSTN